MVHSKWPSKVRRILVPAAILYLAAFLLVFVFQRNLIYFPTRIPFASAVELARHSGLEPWTSPSGEFIGWKSLSPTNTVHKRVLVTHGNAGSALDRSDYGQYLRQIEPCDVYILEYPGYGPRAGSPCQGSLFQAADDAIKVLEKDGPVYLIGESLGTGVAAHVAGTHPKSVKALLLIAPYHNLADVAQGHMPIFPAKYMLRDNFRSAEYLRTYHGSLAVLLAGEDTVVPNKFGKRLFDAYTGPKKLWKIPQAGHNDLPHAPPDWWKELLTFWKE